MLYPLKAHAHYFTVFIYLETWNLFLLILPSQTYPDAVKVWTHWYMYTLYRSPADHRRDHTSSYYRCPPQNFCITPWWLFVFDLGISTSKDRVSTPGKSGNLLEDQEKSGKFDIFWKKLGKSKGKKFYPCVFLTFKKPYACRNMCSWIVYGNQLYILCSYLHLVLRWFNIANRFYFNLSEVFFNLDQERKLHAINCVLFFVKLFISSLNSE